MGVGEGTEERVELLAHSGVDVIVVDTAHGHAQGVIDRVTWVKKHFPKRRQNRRPRQWKLKTINKDIEFNNSDDEAKAA